MFSLIALSLQRNGLVLEFVCLFSLKQMVCASESLNNAHRCSSLALAAAKFLKTLPTQVLFL